MAQRLAQGSTGRNVDVHRTPPYWFFRNWGWRISPNGTGGIEIKPAEMNVDGVAESLAVGEAARRVLHLLNPRVDRLGAGVGHFVRAGGHDPVRMGLDHARHALHRLQRTADRGTLPSHPCLARPRAPAVRAQQRYRMLFVAATHGRSVGRCRGARRIAQLLPALLIHVLGVPQRLRGVQRLTVVLDMHDHLALLQIQVDVCDSQGGIDVQIPRVQVVVRNGCSVALLPQTPRPPASSSSPNPELT